MKLPSFDKDLKADQTALAAEGVVGVVAGLTMLGHPKTAHTHLFDKAAGGGGAEGGGGENGMTRVAGASLAALSAYAMDAGLNGNAKQRNMAYKITAGHSAVGAGLGALALAGKRSDATMSDDKLKVATGLLVVNAAYFGWRALKNKKDDDVVTKVAQKTGWGN